MSEPKTSYRLLAIVVISHAMNHLQTSVMSILFPSIMEEFQLGYIQIGLIRTASSFTTGFPQLFISFLRRRFLGKVLLGVGNILLSVMNMISGLAGNFNQFIFCRVVGGIGGSPQHPISASLLVKNFPLKQRGKVLGFNIAGASLASTFAPLIGAALLVSLGWRSTIFICAVPTFFVGLTFILFVKEAWETNDRAKDAPLLGGAFLRAMRDRNVLAISVVRTIFAFRMGVRAFIPIYLINVLIMDITQASLLFSMMLLGGIIGSFMWGYVSDRVSRKSILILVFACASVLFYILTFLRGALLLAIVLFLIGLMTQGAVVQGLLAEVADPTLLDEIFGFYFTLGFTVGSISSVLFGYIVETLGFTSAFTYVSLVTAISIIPTLFISEKRRIS